MRERPGETRTHEQRSDQAWALCERHTIQFFLGDPGLGQSLPHHGHDMLLMRPARQLGYHTAPFRMHLLRGHHIAAHNTVHEDGSGRLVARAFNAEDGQ